MKKKKKKSHTCVVAGGNSLSLEYTLINQRIVCMRGIINEEQYKKILVQWNVVVWIFINWKL